MTPLVALETSPYELVAGSVSAPLALQVSPVTFKSLMSSLIDLLVEQRVPAIVWAKLPRGNAWQLELDRYHELTDIPHRIYLFKNQREEPTEGNPPDDQLIHSNGLNIDDLVQAAEHNQSFAPPAAVQDASAIVPVQLPVGSPLKREYFLLIWSESFCAALVSHRSKMAHTARIDGDVSPAIQPEMDEVPEKKQLLMALLSLDPQTVRQAIERLQQAALGETSWEASIAKFQPTETDAALINQLFVKQLQRQEELWQRATTYRRQAEMTNLLQLQNEELLNTIRLKDDFLNNVGQELRTPLTNMKTALTLLNSPTLKPTQRQRYMDLLVRECDRQSLLITSLLDLVSLDQMVEQTAIQSLQLIDVVPGVVSTYQPLAEEKGVRLAYTVPENLPSIACLNSWLKQIVINLLHNGIKFTPRGGQVWVRAKQQGDYIQLEFKDTGIGIPPNEIPKIFDRFYRVRQTTEEDAGGSGLGLTIVQKLLLHCGGSISVKSRVGEGSTFNVLLPIYRGQEEKAD